MVFGLKQILIVSQHYPPEKSGNASRIYDMAVNLSNQGISVVVASPPPTFPTGTFRRSWKAFESLTAEGVRNVRFWTWQPQKRDPKFFERSLYYILFPLHVALWLLYRRRKFDVIITSSPPTFTAIPGLLCKILFSSVWIMDVRDRWIDASVSLGFLKKGCFFEKISRKFENICYDKSDLIAVTTKELGKNLSLNKDLGKKIILIPNGVNVELFYPINKARKDQIIYTGNIGHAQDLDKVILALKQIIRERSLRMVLVGDGDIKERLEELARSEGLENLVQFRGAVPREMIPEMLSESRLGLAPLKKIDTLEYAVPTKVYEYMACKLPFLGCGNGEIVDLAKESGAGIIVDNDPQAIAKIITDLFGNPGLLEEMGAKGTRYVRENYDRKEIAHKLKEYIEMIG